MTDNVLLNGRRVQAAVTKPPTTEQGSSLPDAAFMNNVLTGMGLPNWSYFHHGDDMEHVPELKWQPNGQGQIQVYHQMRSDSQVQGLYNGTTLPLRRYGWFLEPNGARDEVVQMFSEDVNIRVRGHEDMPLGRTKNRFSWDNHLRHILLAILYGHMFFEQVGEIDSNVKWRLRKLGERMPQSIWKIQLTRNGGLDFVVQRGMGMTAGGKERRLDIGRLVAYVWEREGSNWTGRSMLRGIYKNFLLKDTILRVGAINIERAGGVPVIEGPKGATPEDLAELGKMARNFRVGANAGGAIPNGAQLTLARAAGGEEAANYVKLMNDEMARGWLMMFMNLGSSGTHGSYALSNTLVDFVLNTHEAIAQWVCDVFSEHVIEDYVDWNWGPDEPAPRLVYKRTDNKQMALRDLSVLVGQGAITMDDELEAWIRETYQMPRFDAASETVRQPPAAGSPLSGADGPSGVGGTTTIGDAAGAKAAQAVLEEFEGLNFDEIQDKLARMRDLHAY